MLVNVQKKVFKLFSCYMIYKIPLFLCWLRAFPSSELGLRLTLHQDNWHSMLCFWEFACGKIETASVTWGDYSYTQTPFILTKG